MTLQSPAQLGLGRLGGSLAAPVTTAHWLNPPLEGQ